MREKEIIQSMEYSTARKQDDHRLLEISGAGSTAVESLAKRHEELFAAVQEYLPAALLDRLLAKALRERELLGESFEREQQIAAAAKKAVHVLNTAFFRIIKMEPHIFD